MGLAGEFRLRHASRDPKFPQTTGESSDDLGVLDPAFRRRHETPFASSFDEGCDRQSLKWFVATSYRDNKMAGAQAQRSLPGPVVFPTSLSLLERLRDHPSQKDWQQLHDLYVPLIRCWLARTPDLQDEVDDVTQEVMIVVVREIAVFERKWEGSFRSWLRDVTFNRVRSFWQARNRRPLVGIESGSNETDRFLDRLADPSSDLSRQWDQDHDRFVFDRLIAAIRGDYQEKTWEAFRLFAINGRTAAETASITGMTVSAVFLAKSRILKRLREEAGALLD